ncbi:MAG TPA: DUF202 domain-containing protein [Stackebrandtia sp.]|uniref:YidH family protein n=1 Tax=Stackebrandtia sp. TaxID=2023065 RepID=UPI002D7248D2|nr:DUF202 domain-containing protein [Stackebrandtia sp.]HZE42105.1 DUF202 domain-containing protein [Stackebrandtia sp.]
MSDHEDDTSPGIVAASLDPKRLREVGKTPDYRFSLANERTFLAWLRTALALVGGGIAVAQFLPKHSLREALAAVLMVVGAACAVRAVVYWTACERAMRLRRDLPASRFPTMLAALVCVGALALLVAVVSGAFQR